jgi:hypothetical protein
LIYSAYIGINKLIYSAANPANGCRDTISQSIKVVALPKLSFPSNVKDEYCYTSNEISIAGLNNNDTVTSCSFTGLGLIDPNPNDGLVIFNPFKTGGPGIYPISFAYTDANGCSNNYTKNIKVNALPHVSITWKMVTVPTRKSDNHYRSPQNGISCQFKYLFARI